MATPRPSTSRSSPLLRHAFFLAALWAAALAAYSNSFGAGLVFDSQRVILADSRIQADTPQNVHEIWTGDYYNGTGASALYRPLTTLSFLWNYAIQGNGPQAVGYHSTNLYLHALNIALVYLLGLLLFENAWLAFAMAALWGLHPVLTESVTNVVGRADLLSGFGVLAGLLCHSRIPSATGWRRALWIAGLAASAAVAVFSKESGVVLIAVLIAYDVALAPKAQWRLRAASYVAVLAPIGLILSMRSSALSQVSSLLISFGDNPLQGAGFLAARLTAVRVLAEYVWLLLWPARLSADYSYHQIPVGALDPAIIAALVLWLGVAAAAVVSYRRTRPVLFGILFFLVAIAPVSNIFLLVGSIMAERFLYLPSIGFFVCLVWIAKAIPRRTAGIALAVVCLVLGVRTYARNNDWHDERSLWASALEASPQSYKTHQNMALVLLAQSQPDYAAAARQVEQALAILDPLPDDRSMPSVYATAGLCYRQQGNLQKALAVLLRGRKIDAAWNRQFLLRNRQDGKTVNAVGTPALYLDLGRVYRDLGQFDNAIEAFRFGRAIDPQVDFFEELSRTYLAMAQGEQAAISLLEALAIDSSQPALISELTQVYQQTASFSCALNRTAPTVDLSCPLVHAQLCTASRNVSQLFTQLRDVGSAGAVAQNAVKNYGCAAEMFR